MESSILQLSQIVRDSGTQSRAAMDQDTIADYRDSIDDARRQNTSAGAWPFPPVEVFYDGEKYHLADGFHRVAAAIQASVYQIPANIHQGTRRDAVLASVGANATHGLRRTNEDKRRAVQTLLRDEEWQQWSDREIGRRCHVSHPTVAAIRAEMVATGKITSTEERKYVHANGAETTMQTVNIGSNGTKPAESPRREHLTIGQLREKALQWLESNDGTLNEFMIELDDAGELYVDTAAASGLSEARIILARKKRVADAMHSPVDYAYQPGDKALAVASAWQGETLVIVDVIGPDNFLVALDHDQSQRSNFHRNMMRYIQPDPDPVARMVLYGDNGQTITRDLVPAPPAPALDPEANRYDGYQRQTFVNEHGHTETRWVAVERPQEDPVLKLLKQAEDAVGRAIAAYDVQAHFDAFRKTNGIYSSLLEVIRLYEYGTSV